MRFMLPLIIEVATREGDLERVNHGEVTHSYVDELGAIEKRAELVSEIGDEEQLEEIKKEFNEIWDKISSKFGLKHQDCMLSVNRRTNILTEIVAINEEMHEDFNRNGLSIRMKSEVVTA